MRYSLLKQLILKLLCNIRQKPYHWFTNQHSRLKNHCCRHWRPEAILFVCSQQHPSSLTSNTGIWGKGWDITSLSPTWSFSRRRICHSCLWITFRPLLSHVKESVQRSQSSCSFPNMGKFNFCFIRSFATMSSVLLLLFVRLDYSRPLCVCF